MTIYLPADLVAEVRRLKISPSVVCRAALKAEVKRAERRPTKDAAEWREQQSNQQEAK